jgi:hypothetical protein
MVLSEEPGTLPSDILNNSKVIEQFRSAMDMEFSKLLTEQLLKRCEPQPRPEDEVKADSATGTNSSS